MQILSKSAIVCIQLFHSYTKQYCTTRSIELGKKARLLFQQDGAFFLQNRPKWCNVITRTRLVHCIIMNEPCVTGHYDVIDTSIENVTMFTAT